VEIINSELLKATLASNGLSVKFLLGDGIIVFFPLTQQHRDIKSHGLSYEDDYRGNAVAGLVTPSGAEIRYHKGFSDDRIRALWARLRALPECSDARLGRLLYQGREIH
jgi:hypothetical protein